MQGYVCSLSSTSTSPNIKALFISFLKRIHLVNYVFENKVGREEGSGEGERERERERGQSSIWLFTPQKAKAGPCWRQEPGTPFSPAMWMVGTQALGKSSYCSQVHYQEAALAPGHPRLKLVTLICHIVSEVAD